MGNLDASAEQRELFCTLHTGAPAQSWIKSHQPATAHALSLSLEKDSSNSWRRIIIQFCNLHMQSEISTLLKALASIAALSTWIILGVFLLPSFYPSSTPLDLSLYAESIYKYLRFIHASANTSAWYAPGTTVGISKSLEEDRILILKENSTSQWYKHWLLISNI